VRGKPRGKKKRSVLLEDSIVGTGETRNSEKFGHTGRVRPESVIWRVSRGGGNVPKEEEKERKAVKKTDFIGGARKADGEKKMQASLALTTGGCVVSNGGLTGVRKEKSPTGSVE